jgi:hypothetical protein
MWLLPLLALGLALALTGHRERGLATAPPGPLAVLSECMRTGRPPPPQVILCAIAEAEDLGRPDVAHKIVVTFVEPVVREHQRRLAGRRAPAQLAQPYEGGGEDAEFAMQDAQAALPSKQLRGKPIPTLALEEADDNEVDVLLERAAAVEQGRAPMAAPRSLPAPRARRDSLAFPTDGYPEPERVYVGAAPAERSVEELLALPSPRPAAPRRVAREQVAAPASPVEVVAAPAPAPGSAPERRVAPGPAATASPIRGVGPAAWEAFVVRLVRETPAYQSSKHVGQYRQRKDRLRELGLPSTKLLGDATAQRAALDADLADAYKHASDGEMLQHVGRLIALPGVEAPTRVTLSGVLGVIQAAGLEGAEGWLSSQKDRKAYPHTTAAYVRSNGVF